MRLIGVATNNSALNKAVLYGLIKYVISPGLGKLAEGVIKAHFLVRIKVPVKDINHPYHPFPPIMVL
jgi:hypothetical protein